MTDNLHDTILDVARTYQEPRIFCAIKQPGEKVIAHLSWIRQADIERMPVEFLKTNLRMGARK